MGQTLEISLMCQCLVQNGLERQHRPQNLPHYANVHFKITPKCKSIFINALKLLTFGLGDPQNVERSSKIPMVCQHMANNGPKMQGRPQNPPS